MLFKVLILEDFMNHACNSFEWHDGHVFFKVIISITNISRMAKSHHANCYYAFLEWWQFHLVISTFLHKKGIMWYHQSHWVQKQTTPHVISLFEQLIIIHLFAQNNCTILFLFLLFDPFQRLFCDLVKIYHGTMLIKHDCRFQNMNVKASSSCYPSIQCAIELQAQVAIVPILFHTFIATQTTNCHLANAQSTT